MTAARQSTFPYSRARLLLDAHFDRHELTSLLGTDDDRVIELAREATWKPLADLLARPSKGVRARLVERAHAIVREHAAPRITADLPPDLPHLFELLHAGSLVVDDIEDDAHTRRGEPAVHRVIGTARAINAGTLLYFLPLWLCGELGLEPAVALAIHRAFARQVLKCHHGQALDLAGTVTSLPQRDVGAIVEACSALKTGALFELVATVGAVVAGASPSVRAALAKFAREAGIALQMLDDLTSVTRPARHAKGLEDLRAARPTWVWAVLARTLDAREYAALVTWLRRLAVAGEPSGLLAELAPLVAPAEALARARWRNAVSSLRATLGPLSSIDGLVDELEALERDYGR